MIRVALLTSMAALSVLTAGVPAHAEGAQKQASFDEKKAQAKVACIKAAEDMKALKTCK